MLYYQLRNELWKLFGKKRTYIGFAMCLLAEGIIILLFRYAHGPQREMARQIERMGFSIEKFLTNLTIATAVMVPVAFLLLPLYVALVGGDLMAKESEDGTLRMILSRPISRLRLVTTKWLAGAIFSIVLVLVFGGFGIGFASLFFHSGSLFALMPVGHIFGVYEKVDGWQHYIAATLTLSVNAITIMGLAWMFSCCNVKPAAATILALSLMLISRVIQDIPYFQDWQQWFITYHLAVWMKMFGNPYPIPSIVQSISILCGYNLTFFIIGASIFQTRDIKS
jgi:ABC-2 type transport system permease protein